MFYRLQLSNNLQKYGAAGMIDESDSVKDNIA